MNAPLSLQLDLRNVEASNGVQIIPAAWYKVMIDDTSVDVTSASKTAGNTNNQLLKVRMTVLEGPYANRKVFKMYNIKNDNATAQEIGLKELRALTDALGHPGLLNSKDELHGVPFMAKVKVRKATDQYEESNDVSSVLHVNKPLPANAVVSGGAAPGAAPSGSPSFAAPQAPAPAAAGGAPSFAAPNFAAPAPAAAAPTAPAPVAAPVAPPVAPAPVAPPVAPAAPAHDPVQKALADGWAQHPEAPDYLWKGSDVVLKKDMAEKYPAPVAAPAAPTAPAAPAAPQAPSAPAAPATAAAAPAVGTAVTPPWMVNPA